MANSKERSQQRINEAQASWIRLTKQIEAAQKDLDLEIDGQRKVVLQERLSGLETERIKVESVLEQLEAEKNGSTVMPEQEPNYSRAQARIQRLLDLQMELAQIPQASYPDDLWPEIESWIFKVMPVIRRDWPDCFQDLQTASSKDTQGGVIITGPGLSISERERHRLWRNDNEAAERVRRNLLSFIDGLLL